MATSKHIDKICVVVTVLTLLLTVIFMNGSSLGIAETERTLGYEERLFSSDTVHTIDIVTDDWDGFISTCENEQYVACTVIIDGEASKNVGIRGKGNTSLSSVKSMGSERYSFKVEFDQYVSGKTYYGLDKLCLNNLIQDNTMMKDYLVYTLMDEFGVDAPLCSFAYLTVNGEDWGLYLAVEGVEDSFLSRNYNGSGDLYKPDSTSFGGGRGNGKNFDMANGGMNGDDVKLKYIDDSADSYSNIFNNAKTEVTSADEQRLIASLKSLSAYEDLENILDIDEVLRYFVVHNFVCNGDSYTGSMIHNYYLHEYEGRLSMIPWDYNLAFGTFQGGSASSTVNSDIDSPVSNGTVDDRPMVGWIFSDESYTAEYHTLMAEFVTSLSNISQRISATADMIRPYVEKDPTKFCTAEEFETGVTALTEFMNLRATAVSRQLAGDTTAVDTGDLNLSDMGTMGNTMGGNQQQGGQQQGENGGQRQRPDQMPDTSQEPIATPESTETEGIQWESEASAMSFITVTENDTTSTDGNGMTPPGGFNGGGDPPAMPTGDFDPTQQGGPGGFMPQTSDGSFDPSQQGGSGGFMPQTSDGSFDPSQQGGNGRDFNPTDFGGNGTLNTDLTSWALVAVSALVLAVGLVIAVKFKCGR